MAEAVGEDGWIGFTWEDILGRFGATFFGLRPRPKKMEAAGVEAKTALSPHVALTTPLGPNSVALCAMLKL